MICQRVWSPWVTYVIKNNHWVCFKISNREKLYSRAEAAGVGRLDGYQLGSDLRDATVFARRRRALRQFPVHKKQRFHGTLRFCVRLAQAQCGGQNNRPTHEHKRICKLKFLQTYPYEDDKYWWMRLQLIFLQNLSISNQMYHINRSRSCTIEPRRLVSANHRRDFTSILLQLNRVIGLNQPTLFGDWPKSTYALRLHMCRYNMKTVFSKKKMSKKLIFRFWSSILCRKHT